IVSSGSPLALIASSLRSTSKKPVCPMTRSLHPPMAHCRQRVRFAATWREEFFEVPSKLSLTQKLFGNQDDLLGFTHALFFGPALQADQNPKVVPFDLPPIDADAFTVVIDSFFPILRWHLQKVGHQHYEFVRPLLTVQRLAIFNGDDPCADQQEAFSAAV